MMDERLNEIKEILEKICEVYKINYGVKERCETIYSCEPCANFGEHHFTSDVQSIYIVQGIGGVNSIDIYDFLYNHKWKFAETFFIDNYQSHLQEMILKEDPFDYLEDYYNDHWVKFIKEYRKLNKFLEAV